MRIIHATGVSLNSPIIDIGGGASILVDNLLADGFSEVTVLDLSGAAIAAAQNRLDARSSRVRWVEGDITQTQFPPNS